MAESRPDIEAIFSLAQQKRPQEQAAYLDEVCSNDLALRRRVEQLLNAQKAIGSFLENPPVQRPPGQLADQAPPDGTQAESPSNTDDSASLEFLPRSEKPGSLGRLMHYEVLAVIGRGGMGIVLRAFDERLQRVVAIKVMAPELAATSPPRKRFLREARATAAVRHENVIAIHAVEDQPTPFLVMEYIAGQTLQQKLDQTGPLEVVEVLHIGQQIARGLEAAHAQGLIHRDIKPANLLLEGEPGAVGNALCGVLSGARVKITDFGLARTADDASVTQSGVIAGTPMYMAPEQARGDTVDSRADLFSLGSVLYTMCSGRPPFRHTTPMAMLKRVAEDTPRPIREIIPEVPEWLCDIIAKLHVKKPEERFQSAKEVADLLAQHLAHLEHPSRGPMPAPPGQLGKPAGVARTSEPPLSAVSNEGVEAVVLDRLLAKDPAEGDASAAKMGLAPEAFAGEGSGADLAGRRKLPRMPVGRRWLVSGLIGVAALFVTGLLLAREKIIRIRDKDGKVKTEIRVAEGDQVEVIENGKPVQPPSSATRKPLSGSALVGQPAALGGVRGWTLETIPHRGSVLAVAYRPDGRLFATGGADGCIRLWDAATGRLLRVLVGHANRVLSLAWSPDGKVLASASYDSASGVRLWECDSGRVLHVLKEVTRALAWSPNGKVLALGMSGNSGRLRLWDVSSGKMSQTLESERGGNAHTALAYSPDGKMIAAAHSWKDLVEVWDVASGRRLHQFQGRSGAHSVLSLAWSPDQGRLVTGDNAWMIRIWEVESGKQLHSVRDGALHASVAWSSDGKTLATAGDGGVVIRDAGTGQIQHRLGSNLMAEAVAISPDGKALVAGYCDGAVLVCDLKSHETLLTLQGYGEQLERVSLSPDGSALALASTSVKERRSAQVRLFEANSGRQRFLFRGASGPLAWSPNGKALATADGARAVCMWDAKSGERLGVLEDLDEGFSAMAWSPGAGLAIGARGIVKLYEPKTSKLLHAFPGHKGEEIEILSWSPDGNTLLTAGSRDNDLRLWDATSGRLLNTLKDHVGAIYCVSWSPDGKTLAFGGGDGKLRYWDRKSGRCTGDEKAGDRLRAVTWLQNGKTCASWDDSGNVRSWNVHLGTSVRAFQTPMTNARAVADKDSLALPLNNALYLWDLQTGRRRGALVVLRDNQTLAIGPEGHYSSSSPVEAQLVYIVETEQGQETLAPEKFARKYDWKNDPQRVQLIR